MAKFRLCSFDWIIDCEIIGNIHEGIKNEENKT